jgi:hypothetical protein
MRIVGSICLFFILLGCKKSVSPSDCMQSKVDEFKSSVLCTSDASVKEYSFQNKFVYVFTEGYCVSDWQESVYDMDCSYLGYLGGFGGATKINGVDFYSNAKYKRTVWHN